MIPIKRPLQTRADIEEMVNAFYEKVRTDDQLGFLFDSVARVDWHHHLPRMYDFWEFQLTDSPVYGGNPMGVHLRLHHQYPLTPAHFNRWKQLFVEAVDEQFEGGLADLAKQRAISIATVMQIKILQSN